jgi:putative two-component system response regulator
VGKQKKIIMVIDDEPVNVRVLVDLLQPHYRIRAGSTGETALEILGKPPLPDLILLDVMMPEIDGYSLLKKLRLNPGYREIPVIFVTALQDETDEKHGFELGAADYITKPIRPAIVLARVAAQLELKDARDRLKNQNDWLESEVHRRMRENILIQDVTLAALAELAETRDSDTGLHIHRTQSYVETLTRHMSDHSRYAAQLGENHRHHIVKAAPLHDIGKVGIEDKILLKPGLLSDNEYDVMKKHTTIGGQTIGNAISKALRLYEDVDEEACDTSLAFLNTAQQIALYHHERWDGKGYPEGLKGENIPLGARFMALADVYDAMTSKRVYKPAMPHDEVVKHIKMNGGKQFDPDIVDAFIATEHEFSEIRNLH